MKRNNNYPKYKETGIHWIGNSIPAHWELRRMKYLFRLVTDQAEVGNNEELLSVYTSIGVKPRKELEERGNKASTTDNYWRVQKGDIVVNKLLAWMGAIGISEYEGVTSPAYDVLRKKEDINPYYYNYLFRLSTSFKEFKRHSRGIMDMRLRLYFDEFGKLFVPLPPKEEQDKIVAFIESRLEKINTFIEKKKRLLAVLEEKKQAVINQAVTKGINPNNIKMKDSGIEWLGEVPKHWEIGKLKNYFQMSPSNVDKKTYEGERNVNLCNYVDVYKNLFIDGSFEFMKASCSDEQFKKFLLKKGDVIITKDSESNEDIASPALTIQDFENVVCGYHLSLIRTKDEKICIGNFLLYALLSKANNHHFVLNANGVTRFGLSKQAINDLPFLLPPLKEQKQIISYIEKETQEITKAQTLIQKEIKLIQEYKNALISEAVTGKIDVRKWEQPN